MNDRIRAPDDIAAGENLRIVGREAIFRNDIAMVGG
jgi:hypothetical protein